MLVVIKNHAGLYLSLVRGQVAFVEEKRRAVAYDFDKDHVEDQLAEVKRRFSAEWTCEEVQPGEAVDNLPRTKEGDSHV